MGDRWCGDAFILSDLFYVAFSDICVKLLVYAMQKNMEKETLSVNLIVRLTPSQKQKVAATAKSMGFTPSDYVRSLLPIK